MIHSAGKPHRNGCADTDLALNAERSTVQLDEGFGQRQAEPGPFVFAIEGAVDLREGS